MSIAVEVVTAEEADRIKLADEGQFCDVKAIDIKPGDLTKTISAFANSDGGDLYVGIDGVGSVKTRSWRGFRNVEAANGHIQCFVTLFPLGQDYQYEFLRCDSLQGLVLHVQVNKTRAYVKASNSIPYLRRGASELTSEGCASDQAT